MMVLFLQGYFNIILLSAHRSS